MQCPAISAVCHGSVTGVSASILHPLPEPWLCQGALCKQGICGAGHGCPDAQRDAASTEMGSNHGKIFFFFKKTTTLFLQIGSLENYYHFHHSKTFKRSTLSSRGPHNFLRMDPKVRGWAAWGPPASGGAGGMGVPISPGGACYLGLGQA